MADPTTTTALAKLDRAVTALAEAKSLSEVTYIRDIAVAAAAYAKASRLGTEAINHAEEVKLRAERKAGSMLSQLERFNGGQVAGRSRPKDADAPLSSYRQVLLDEDIPERQAQRWQKIAEMDDGDFEESIERVKKSAEG